MPSHPRGVVTSWTPPIFPREERVLPHGEDWIYELLWGGERVRALKRDGAVRLLSKDGRDLANRFPRVAAAVARVHQAHAVLDGEILMLDGYSAAVVQRLARVSDDITQARVAFVAYDLLEVEGVDLRSASLICRRLKLTSVAQSTPIILSPWIDDRPENVLAEAARLELPGVVAKRAGSAYRPNAVVIEWVKVLVSAAAVPVGAGGTTRPW